MKVFINERPCWCSSTMESRYVIIPTNYSNGIIGPVTESRTNGRNDLSIPKHIYKCIHLKCGSSNGVGLLVFCRESARLKLEADHISLSCKCLKRLHSRKSAREVTGRQCRAQRRSQSAHTV